MEIDTEFEKDAQAQFERANFMKKVKNDRFLSEFVENGRKFRAFFLGPERQSRRQKIWTHKQLRLLFRKEKYTHPGKALIFTSSDQKRHFS